MKKRILILLFISLFFGDQTAFGMKRKRESDDGDRELKRRKVMETCEPEEFEEETHTSLEEVPNALFADRIFSFALGAKARGSMIDVANELTTFALISKRFKSLLFTIKGNESPILANLRAFFKDHHIRWVPRQVLNLFFKAIDRERRLKLLLDLHEYGDYDQRDCQAARARGRVENMGGMAVPFMGPDIPFTYSTKEIAARKERFRNNSEKPRYHARLECRFAGTIFERRGRGGVAHPFMPLPEQDNLITSKYHFALQLLRSRHDTYTQKDVYKKVLSFPGDTVKLSSSSYVVTRKYFEVLIKIAQRMKNAKNRFQLARFTAHDFDNLITHLSEITTFIDSCSESQEEGGWNGLGMHMFDNQRNNQRKQTHHVDMPANSAQLLTYIIDLYHELASLDLCLRQNMLVPVISLIEQVCPNQSVLKRLKAKLEQIEKRTSSQVPDFIIGARYGNVEYLKKYVDLKQRDVPHLLLTTATQHNQTDTIKHLRGELKKRGLEKQVVTDMVMHGASQGYFESIKYIFKTLKFLDEDNQSVLIDLTMQIESAMQEAISNGHLKIFYYLCKALRQRKLDGMIEGEIWKIGFRAALRENNVELVKFLAFNYGEKLFAKGRTWFLEAVRNVLQSIIAHGYDQVLKFLHEYFDEELGALIKNSGIDFSFLRTPRTENAFMRLLPQQTETFIFLLKTFPEIVTIDRLAYLLGSAVCSRDLKLLEFLCDNKLCWQVLSNNSDRLNVGFRLAVAKNKLDAGFCLLSHFSENVNRKMTRSLLKKAIKTEQADLSYHIWHVYGDFCANKGIKGNQEDIDLVNRALELFAKHQHSDGIIELVCRCSGMLTKQSIQIAMRVFAEAQNIKVLKCLSRIFFGRIVSDMTLVLPALEQSIKKSLTDAFTYLKQAFCIEVQLIPADRVVSLFKIAAGNNNVEMQQFLAGHPEIQKLFQQFKMVRTQANI